MPLILVLGQAVAGSAGPHTATLAVVIINGLAGILFMIGYVLFGIAMIRTGAMPRWCGILVAWLLRLILLGFGILSRSRPRPPLCRSRSWAV
jgi:hypothetical protein